MIRQNHGFETKEDALKSLSDFNISYITDTENATDHCHPCYKVIISLDHNFECSIDGQDLLELRGLIVNQTVPHSIFAGKSNILVILIKTVSDYGRQIQRQLEGRAWLEIDTTLAPELLKDVLSAGYKDLTNQVLVTQIHTFLDLLCNSQVYKKTAVEDDRIKSTLQFIQLNLHWSFELEHVAACVNLSAERTRHLFVLETGLPMSQYVLWKRILKVMSVAVNEESLLSEVCIRYGFADQSHFNHSYKRIFGLTPGSMIKSCRILI